MNKFEINQNELKNILDAVKHSISKDEYRPIMKFIQLRVNKNILTVSSLDGYRASRLKVNLGDVDFGEFNCYIKPVTIKTTKRGIEKATIESDGKVATVEVMTDFGKCKYSFVQPDAEFFDLDKIYDSAQSHECETILNARYLCEAAKSIGCIDNNYRVVLETKKDGSQAIILRCAQSGIINEQLILPVRKV